MLKTGIHVGHYPNKRPINKLMSAPSYCLFMEMRSLRKFMIKKCRCLKNLFDASNSASGKHISIGQLHLTFRVC